MKILPTVAALLAFALSSHAQEPNPFVKKETEKSPAPPSGDSFVSLVEHILVPADQLDAWLEKNPLPGDASNLRKQVQRWVGEKSARLDHTALSTGIGGRESLNSSVWERIYATEYEPPEPGEWPMPTAFDTRDIGYKQSGGAAIEDGAMLLRGKMEYVKMLPHHPWSQLAERTRQPDDIFIPRFRSIEVSRMRQDATGKRIPYNVFLQPKDIEKLPPGADQLRFDPGKTYLLSREDNDSQLAKVSPHPQTTITPEPKDPHHLVRLIFFRGNILPPVAATQSEPLEINSTSLKLIRVEQPVFSAWIQENDLLKIPDLAWAAATDWQKNGRSETTVDLTNTNPTGLKCRLERIEKVSYPTEWRPGKITPATEGKPAQRNFSKPTSFDTRDCGTALAGEMLPDPKGPICKLKISRTIDKGKTVHHRILRDGEWKPDITFPLFFSNYWNSEIRVKSGEWLLIGSGAEIDAKGNFDPEHTVLAFIKLN